MTLHQHIVPMPRWNTPVGCCKFVLAIIVLAFIAACTAIWGEYAAFGFSLFTASSTLVIFAYYLISLTFNVSLYNRWAVLGLEILQTIFWLVSMALLADWTQWHRGWDSYYRTLRSTRAIVRDFEGSKFRTAIGLAGASAGLAGLEFVLFLLSLITFSINLHKHRQTGNPAVSAAPDTVSGDDEILQHSESDPAVIVPPQPRFLGAETAEKEGIRPPTPVEKAHTAEVAAAKKMAKEMEQQNTPVPSLAATPNSDSVLDLSVAAKPDEKQ